jgi:hypothetical protein
MSGTSGYYDHARPIAEGTVGAWTLCVGTLPDGRYAVDHYSRADGRKQRLYFSDRAEALTYARTFGAPSVPEWTETVI